MKNCCTIFIALWCLLCVPIFAQTTEEIYRAYYHFEDALFMQIHTEAQIDTMYNELVPKLQVLNPPEKRYFFLARAEFFRGLACAIDFMQEYNTNMLASDFKKPPKLKIPEGLTAKIDAYLNRSLELCELSLAANATADGYLGKGMLVLSRAGLNGSLAAFFAMFKFLDLSKLAHKIDPNNFEAALMQAVIRAFPPPPFGNPKKGIDDMRLLMQKITPQTPKMDLFICYVSVATAYMSLKENDNALFWLNKAQAVYPENKSLELFEKRLLTLEN